MAPTPTKIREWVVSLRDAWALIFSIAAALGAGAGWLIEARSSLLNESLADVERIQLSEFVKHFNEEPVESAMFNLGGVETDVSLLESDGCIAVDRHFSSGRRQTRFFLTEARLLEAISEPRKMIDANFQHSSAGFGILNDVSKCPGGGAVKCPDKSPELVHKGMRVASVTREGDDAELWRWVDGCTAWRILGPSSLWWWEWGTCRREH